MNTQASISQSRSASRLSARSVWLLAAFAIAALVGIGAEYLLTSLNDLPVIAPAPPFTLTNQNGESVSSADLLGQIVVYNFIYTSCETVCPAMTGQMLQLQRLLDEKEIIGSGVTLVTITFDPERDTPERLGAYARQMNAESEGWLWLTGEPVAVRQVVGAEFGVYFEKLAPGDAVQSGASEHGHRGTDEDTYDFVHDTTFILVDERGMIRAEYHEFPGSDAMLRDITGLLREKNTRGLTDAVQQIARLVQWER